MFDIISSFFEILKLWIEVKPNWPFVSWEALGQMEYRKRDALSVWVVQIQPRYEAELVKILAAILRTNLP